MTGLRVEFSRNGRQRNGCSDLFQDLSEGRGVRFVEREILAEQRCGDCSQTGMRSQRSEKCLWEISRRPWSERAARNRENGCWRSKEAQVCNGGSQISQVACDDVADKSIDIDIEPEQIRDAASESVSVVGHEIMTMDSHEHGLNIDDRIDQEQQVDGTGLHCHLEGDACGQVARHDDQGSGRPCMLHKLHNFKEVGLHAPQGRLFQFAVAQP